MALDSFIHIWKDKGGNRTFLLLHGTGGTENDLVGLAETVSPEANILSLRGNSHEEGLNRFFRRKAEGVLDEDDIRVRTQELSQFIHAAAKEYSFALNGLVATGYSNGANIAAALLLRFPHDLAGAILLRPMAPFQAQVEGDPIGPVLILSGLQDRIIPASQTELLVKQLTDRESKVTWDKQNSGHELVRNDLIEMKSWLNDQAF